MSPEGEPAADALLDAAPLDRVQQLGEAAHGVPARPEIQGAHVGPTAPQRGDHRNAPIEGAVRKDGKINALNTDYDLYSVGADGESVAPLSASASKDDVIRALNGGFIGLASNF